MAKIVKVIDWDKITPSKIHLLHYIRVQQPEQIHKIAERLKLPLIFKKQNELLCRDGYIIYWYKE